MKHKILFFIESLSGGGAEKVLVTLLKYLKYELYEITLLVVNERGVYLDDINRLNIINGGKITVKSLCGKGNNMFQKIKYKLIYRILPTWLVYWLFVPKDYDTYVAFVEGYCTKILSYLKKNKIAWVHIDLKNHPWTIDKGIYKTKEEEKAVYNKYNKVICVSQSVENIMCSYYKLKNTVTIYNPIDTEYILQAAEESNVKMSSAFNIISVGRLVVQKGYDLLIPIIARLQYKGLDVHLYILGEGSERETLENLIDELQIRHRVHLMGYVNNPYPYIKKANLFVCSSRAEGYSLVVAESLILGVPVVSIYCSGPNEVLGFGRYGILCDDYEQLENTIEGIIKDSGKYKQLRKQTRLDLERFNTQQIVNQIEAILI